MDVDLTSPSQNQAVIAAIRAYLKTSPTATDALIEVEKLAGDHARVRIRDANDRLTPATGYLRRQVDQWKVLAIGTLFKPADLDKLKIPATVRRG